MIENFNNKDLSIFSDRLFVSDDFYVVQNIYSLYGDKLFYYFRDDLWLISNEIINQQKPIINQSILSKYQELNLGLNNKVDLDKLIGGLGWSKKLSSEGLVSDGYFSTIIFKTNKENCKVDNYLKKPFLPPTQQVGHLFLLQTIRNLLTHHSPTANFRSIFRQI